MMKLQQEQGFNPLGGLPADVPADPDLHLAVPRAAAHRELRGRLRHTRPRRQPPAARCTRSPRPRPATPRRPSCSGRPAGRLVARLRDQIEHMLGGDITSTRIVTIILVIISAGRDVHDPAPGLSRATTVPDGHRRDRAEADEGLHPDLGRSSPACSSRSACCCTGSRATRGRCCSSSTSTGTTRTTPKEAPGDRRPGQDPGAQAGPASGPRSPRAHDAWSRTRPMPTTTGESMRRSAPAPPRSSTPRPGQRPQRQGDSRPPGKRPSQSKKRR